MARTMMKKSDILGRIQYCKSRYEQLCATAETESCFSDVLSRLHHINGYLSAYYDVLGLSWVDLNSELDAISRKYAPWSGFVSSSDDNAV